MRSFYFSGGVSSSPRRFRMGLSAGETIFEVSSPSNRRPFTPPGPPIMATSPPLLPSPSLDDLLVPPIPSATTLSIRDCGDMDGTSVDIFPPFVPTVYVPPPPVPALLPETDKGYSRGRSRSLSRSPPLSERSASPGRLSPSPYSPSPYLPSPYCGPIYVNVPPIPPLDSLYDTGSSLSYCPDYLRSLSPPRHKRSTYRSRTPSPISQSCIYTPPQMFYQPPPPPILPSLTPPPVPPAMWPPAPPAPAPVFLEPVDILTFHYNKNMAYAPAAKTYEVRFISRPRFCFHCHLVYRYLISSDPYD